MSPRRLLAALALISALLVPAAVAWACNPQPRVNTDQLSYSPGEEMTVSGHFFSTNGNPTVTIRTEPAGASATGVPVTSAGTFQRTLDAPDDAGTYTLLAKASNSAAAARTTFTVESPSTTEPPGNPPPAVRFSEPRIQSSPAVISSRPSTPITLSSPQPRGGSSDPTPNSRPQRGGGSSQPSPVLVFDSGGPAPARSTGGGSLAAGSGGGSGGGTGGGGASGGGNSGDGGAASGSEDGVIRDAAGRPVFVDSLAPADRRADRAGRTTTTAADGGPSERAATGDLWSGFRSGKAPSLLDAGDGGTDDGGSGASIGLALLGLGLVGLLSALAVAEVRRRRALAG